MTTYLFELSDHYANKYWIADFFDYRIANKSDKIIKIDKDGSYSYVKNRQTGSKEVLPQDGSFDWITVQILSSKRYERGHLEVGLFYAPYVPLTVYGDKNDKSI